MREKSQLNLKSLTYASAGRCSRARHLGRLATHGKLCLRVAGRLHVRELIGALLREVVEATGDHTRTDLRRKHTTRKYHLAAHDI